MPQNWSVSSCTSIWEVRVQSHGAAGRMRAPSYVNHVVCDVASGAFSLSCSNLFLVINIWLIVPMRPYVYAHTVVIRHWAWYFVYLRLVRITVLSELPTIRLQNSWCNLLAFIEWKSYINVISTATWWPSHVLTWVVTGFLFETIRTGCTYLLVLKQHDLLYISFQYCSMCE